MCVGACVFASLCVRTYDCIWSIMCAFVNLLLSVVALGPSHQVARYAEKGRFEITCTTHYVPGMFSCISSVRDCR